MQFRLKRAYAHARDVVMFECPRHGTLSLTSGHGPASLVAGTTSPLSVLLVLGGAVRLEDGTVVESGRLACLEAGAEATLIGVGAAHWLLLQASTTTWRHLGGHVPLRRDPVLLPGAHDVDPVLRLHFAALERIDDGAGHAAAKAIAMAIVAGIETMQRVHDSLIERCAGRTYGQRRRTFLRMLRVRNAIAAGSFGEQSVSAFARMANYSTHHFIRAFSSVYELTPHAMLVEERLRHAHRLLTTSDLAVSEVARMSGYEDRSAFARSFKRRFGVSASAARHVAAIRSEAA